MLVWLLLCGVVQSQNPLTGTIRPLSSVPSDSGALPTGSISSGLAQSLLVDGRPVFTKADYEPLFSVKSLSTIAYTIPAPPTPTPNLFQFSAEPFYGNASQTFSFELQMDITVASLSNKVLQFNSAGDLWVYFGTQSNSSRIGGVLAVDLGGPHAKLSSDATLDWTAWAPTKLILNNPVVRMYVFYAHRTTVAQPHLKITFANQQVCSAETVGVLVPNLNLSALDTATGLKSSVTQNISGETTLILLANTSLGGQYEAAFAWFPNIQRITSGFMTQFEYLLSGKPNGFAFVFQNFNRQTASVGGGGSNLGYAGQGFSNQAAVEFDVFQDTAVDSGPNRIELHTKYGAENTAAATTAEVTGAVYNQSVLVSTSWTAVTITYAPTGLLQVWLNRVLVYQATMNHTRVLSEIGENVFFGFTTSNGPSTYPNNVYIRKWNLWTTPLSGLMSTATNTSTTWNTPRANDADASADLYISARDPCGRPITLNGASVPFSVSTILAPSGGTAMSPTGSASYTFVPASSRYNMFYYNTLTGNYSLSISFDGQQIATSPLPIMVVADVISQYSTFNVTGGVVNNNVTANIPITVVVTARDRFSNLNYESPATPFLANWASEAASPAVLITAPYYTVNLTTTVGSEPISRGVFVNYNGNPLVSTFSAVVVAGAVDPDKTQFDLPGGQFQSIVAGTTARMTITPYDAWRNRIFNDPGGVISFSMNLPGPIIVNNNTPIVWTTNLTYAAFSHWEYTFNATIAGRYGFYITYQGMVLNTGVSPVVVAGPVAQVSLNYVPATVVAALSGGFTILTQDVYGNLRTDPSDKVLIVQIDGTNTTCGATATNVNGTGMTNLGCSYQGSFSGRYGVSFIPSIQKQLNVSFFLNGVRLATNASILVVSGPPDPITSAITSASASIVAGVNGNLDVVLKDAQGNLVMNRETDVKNGLLLVQITGSSSQSASLFLNSTTESTPGTYTIPFTATLVGSLVWSVTISGNTQNIRFSGTISTTVTPAAPNPAHFVVSGAGLAPQQVGGSIGKVDISLRDVYDNLVSGTDFSSSFSGTVSPTTGPVTFAFTANAATEYQASFTNAVAGSKLIVTISFSATIINNGNFSVLAVTNGTTNATCISGSPNASVAGAPLTIVLVDGTTYGSYPQAPVFSADFSANGSKTQAQTVAPPNVSTSNIWTAQFQSAPTKVGTYKLSIYSNGQPSSACGPCNSICALTVTPANPSIAFSRIDANSTTGTVGTGFYANITVKDQFDNLVPAPTNITLTSSTTSNFSATTLVAPGVLSVFVTTFVATPWEMKVYFGSTLIASRVFLSLAGPPVTGTIVDFASNGSSVGIAGLPYTPPSGFRGYCLVAQDQYNQPITDSAFNSQFTMVMKPDVGDYNVTLGSVLSISFDGTACFQLTFTPLQVNSNGFTPFQIWYNGRMLVQRNAPFVPGAVDISKVKVFGLNSTYVATNAFQFSVLLVDTYGNNITSNADPVYGAVASLPARGRIVGPITSGFLNPLWGFTYPGTASSPGELTFAGNWTIALTYKGASLTLGPVNNFPSVIAVTPGPTAPMNTVVLLPVITSTNILNGTKGLVAGDIANWSYTLYDKFMNPTIGVNNDNVTVSFIPGVREYANCEATSINLPASNLSLPLNSTGVEVTMQADGTGTMYSTYARSVVMYMQVNGQYLYTGPCINVHEVFPVHPAQEDPANTLISGPGLLGGVAGSYLSFVVVLRDRFNNSVNRGGANVTFGPNNVSTCLATYPNVLTVANQSLVDDLDNGTYTTTFQTTQSQSFLLQVSIDGRLAGSNTTCTIVVVSPWYADSATHDAQSAPVVVRAGLPVSIQIQGRDIFTNVVNNQALYHGHSFLTSVDRSICPMYVKKTTSSTTANISNAGAPWVGWDGGSGCVSGAGDLRVIAAQALRTAINNNDCFATCTPLCVTLKNATDLDLYNAAVATSIGDGNLACAIFPDTTATQYNVVYHIDSSTANCYVEPCYANTSTLQNSQTAFFIPEYPGQYSGVFLLQPDPTCKDCAPHFPTTNVNFQVDAATCEQMNPATPYRCLNGTCQSSRANCSEACDESTPYRCYDNSCSATPCTCPSGSVACAGTSHCVQTAALCPAADTMVSVCPTGTVRCWNGVCAPTLAQCPGKRACPPTFVTCPDAQTCVRDVSECGNTTACAAGYFQCQNGRCVMDGDSCPSVPSCPSGVLCPDGSCRPSGVNCADVAPCYAPLSFRCADGACRAQAADCSTTVTCPLGLILCPEGICSSACTASASNCSGGNIRCPDGTCQNNEGLCATRTTCTAATPVLCPDGSCAASVWACAQPAFCNKTLCSNGFCVDNITYCPTTVICPFNAPVKCPDGSCQKNVLSCAAQPRCPYVTCPDGSCRREYDDCPSMSVCPSSTPVRCADGSCRAGAYACPVPSCGSLYRCPGGECMETKSQCPSRVTCPPTFERCVDGTCRSSCASVSVAQCPAGQIACPQSAYGLTCATDISRCPYASTCPPDRPVRCLDATCVFAAKDCIATSSVAVDKTACADGGWASNGAENCYSGVTCPPWSPVKCWDNSCRQLAEDCPLQAPCPISLGGRYLCSDGTCARTLDLCASRGTRCASGLIKCPSGTCAASPALCPNATATSCPDQATLCMDGSCRRTPSIWCRPLLCPLHAPYLCDNGACARDASRCAQLNGCPYDQPIKCPADGSCRASADACPTPNACANGTFLCLDGTGCSADCGCNSTQPGCTAPQANGCKSPGYIRCHDGLCKPYYYCTGVAPKVTLDVEVIPGYAGSNLCPMNKPFRCADGLCAVSSSRCPIYPVLATPACPSSKPYLCANGMCAMSGAECPILVECPKMNGIKRCPNGHCDTICPVINTCPTTQSYRCDNGMCVASADMCVSHLNNNCPVNQTICPDGHCRANGAPCPALRQADGCAAGMMKCADGSCQATCARTQHCPATHPYICSGACSTDPCVGGKMANGCDVASPVRCADGTCKKYPARLGNQTSDRCSPTLVCDGMRPVLCGDGTCVALSKHCRPIICSATLCADGNCSSSCPALSSCPSTQPVLCPDGSCRTTVARCTSHLAVPCALPTPHQCWDGSCKASLLECATRTAQLTSVTFTGAELATTICPTGIVCPNGMCGMGPEDCDIVPSCPTSAPYRCWNGGCYASPAGCPTAVECTDKSTTRCEDGLCRKTCLAYNGCPLSQPFLCPGRAVMCVKNSTDCDSQPQVACSSNCNRDVAASKQSVSIMNSRDTVVEVGLQHNLPRLRVTFPAGAFPSNSAVVDITPARITHLPLSARVVSTPFVVQSTSTLALDLSVDADIDWKRFVSSSSSIAAKAAISCELQASYDITTPYVDAGGAKGTCTGQANITTDSVGIRLDASGTACSSFQQDLVFTNQSLITPWSESTQMSESCLCGETANKTLVCFRAVRDRTQVTMSTYTNGMPGCPSATEVTTGVNVITYNFNPVQNSVDACYLIVRSAYFADVDICLGELVGDRFRCPETRASRVERDWNSPFDQPGVRRIGRVSKLGQVYAFVYSPLPPDAVEYIPPVTWWELYGTTTLGTAIPFGLIFICAALLLFYFNRFRRKYKLEKEHMDHLKDQAADLDQFAGGLGMTDEAGEFDMVPNPMVIEIEALQKQVETVNDALHGQAEEDAAEIDALELERQQLFAEIQRVKEAIATNEKGKAPKRVVESPPPAYEAPAAAGAATTTKSVRRADFGQVRATRKPKDIS